MKKMLIFFLVLSMQGLFGCIPQTRLVKNTVSIPSKNDISISSYPTELRGVYIRKSKGNVKNKVTVTWKDKNGDIKTKDIYKNFVDTYLCICAEPPADTGANATLSATASLSNQLAASTAAAANLTNAINATNNNSSGSEGSRNLSRENSFSNTATNNTAIEASLNLTRKVIELQGRTQLVLMAREFMYRNCEAAANGFISKEDFLAMHELSIRQISEMLKASVVKAEAQKAEADAKRNTAEAEKLKAEAAQILLETEAVNYQAQIKYCSEKNITCIKNASGDAQKEKKCKAIFEKCLEKK